MRKILLLSLSIIIGNSIEISAQGLTGVNTKTPTNNLDVNGSVQVTNEIVLGGTSSTAGDTGAAGYALMSQGDNLPSIWKNLEASNEETGTVLVTGGTMLVAQEITVQMTEDYTYTPRNAPSLSPPWPLGKLNNVILDNKNMFVSQAPNSQFPAGSNSFTIEQTGIYQLQMNVGISTAGGTNPIIGIFDDTAGTWVINVNDKHIENNANQSYTIISSVELVQGNTYSFRANNSQNFTIRWVSGGTTGQGPVSQFKLSRLK